MRCCQTGKNWNNIYCWEHIKPVSTNNFLIKIMGTVRRMYWGKGRHSSVPFTEPTTLIGKIALFIGRIIALFWALVGLICIGIFVFVVCFLSYHFLPLFFS